MTMQIDELVLKLTTDATGFVKGQKEATESIKQTKQQFKKHGEEVEASVKNMFSGVTKLGVAFGGLFAAIGAAKVLDDFARKMAKVDTALGLTAANLGI